VLVRISVLVMGYHALLSKLLLRGYVLIQWGCQKEGHALVFDRIKLNLYRKINPEQVYCVIKFYKITYSRCEFTVETAFGIIKEVMGFRQFHLRGVVAVQGEWSLVCLVWNLKRIYVKEVARNNIK